MTASRALTSPGRADLRCLLVIVGKEQRDSDLEWNSVGG